MGGYLHREGIFQQSISFDIQAPLDGASLAIKSQIMVTLRIPKWLRRHLRKETLPWNLSHQNSNRIKQGLRKFQQKKPLVSIVIPAYNEEKFLLRTLSSLSELQPNHPTELLIVNNGSSDRTLEIIRYLDIEHLALKENLFAKGGRQKGLEAARGDFILQADADTAYHPQWGNDYVRALQDPQNAIVYGRHAFIPNEQMSRAYLSFHETLGESVYKLRNARHAYINVHGFNSAFRKADGLEYGSYEHAPDGSEDGHMAWMLMKIGKIHKVSSIPSCAWTSTRRLEYDGGLVKALRKRILREGGNMKKYLLEETPQDKD